MQIHKIIEFTLHKHIYSIYYIQSIVFENEISDIIEHWEELELEFIFSFSLWKKTF